MNIRNLVNRLSAFSLILFSFSASAGNVWEGYEYLMSLPREYKDFGSVCEEIATQEIKEDYPSDRYEVTGNLVYQNSQRTIGELDIVVLRKEDKEAVVIGEVKCWKKLSQGRSKALRQLERFRNTILSGRPIRIFHAFEKKRLFETDQFDEAPRYITVSQKGGRSEGYDREIRFSHEEMRRLYRVIRECRGGHRCPKSEKDI
ncbi:MAG: hypothetical protein CL678_03280 [Bdellovibrionaceae bacterium]|nr:hypothetical protein [Pseudobdellovibrionaceae bacterium]|tara:strand:+ start:712 stop:1317 length:606 start_codon:yes stop_codon:yes gene_type:complete